MGRRFCKVFRLSRSSTSIRTGFRRRRNCFMASKCAVLLQRAADTASVGGQISSWEGHSCPDRSRQECRSHGLNGLQKWVLLGTLSVLAAVACGCSSVGNVRTTDSQQPLALTAEEAQKAR